jgi:hypothetical protein
LISEAGGQIEKLQTVVADWSDGRMEALSRAYVTPVGARDSCWRCAILR